MRDRVESSALCPLLFPTETHIYFVEPLAHKPTGSRILYVTFRAYAETYTVVNNLTEFTEI